MAGDNVLRTAQPAALPLVPWLALRRTLAILLAGALVAAALLLQQTLLANQVVDIGGRLDGGRWYRFHSSEYSDSLPGGSGPVAATYRWARTASSMRLGPLLPATAYVLDLTMLGPGTGATLDLRAGQQPLGPLALESRLRVYRVLIAPNWLDGGTLNLGFDGEPRQLEGDPRRLLALVDRAAATRLDSRPRLVALATAAPFLPLSALLLLLAARGLRLPSAATLLLPALALAGIAYLLRQEPAAARSAARLLLAAALLACTALAATALLRRTPRLWASTNRSAAAWIVGAWVVALTLFFTPRIASDGVLYYVYLRSLAIDGDWDFANEFSPQSPLTHVLEVDETERMASGYFANAASVGPAIVWIPFFALAHGVVALGSSLGIPWQLDGYAQPYVALISFASALATLGTLLGCFQITRRFVPAATATLATVTLLFGSNLLFYGMAEGSFAHAFSALAATLLVLAWLRLEERPTTARWAMLGIAAGATILMYWITALLLIMPLLTGLRLLFATLRRRDWPAARRLVAQGLLAATLALLLVSPQLLAWTIIYGAPLAAPHGADYITPQGLNLWGVLFSPLYGLLPWTPAFFLGLCGLFLLPARRPWLACCMLAACLAYIGYNASLGRWFAGGSFGMRRLTACAPLFAVGLALLFDRLARWHHALPALTATLVGAWALAVFVRYQNYMISHAAYSLKNMSRLQFYLDGNALPIEALPSTIGGSYLLLLLRDLGGRAAPLYEVLMLAALGACLALTLWGYQRLMRLAA